MLLARKKSGFAVGMSAMSLCLAAGATLTWAEEAPAPRKVGNVHIAGNDSIPTQEIERWMTLHQAGRILKEPFYASDFQADVRRILRFYRREGFLAAEVRCSIDSISTPPDRVDLTVGIFEGPRAVLGSTEFRVFEHAPPSSTWPENAGGSVGPLSSFDAAPDSSAMDTTVPDPAAIAARAVREAFTLGPGDRYCPREIAALRRELLGIAHAHGFADARAEVQVQLMDADAPSRWRRAPVALRAHLVLGERARIGSVSIDGLVKTRGSTVLREITFHAGDLLLPAELDRSRKNLERTGLFRSVTITPVPPDPKAPVQPWSQAPLEPNRKRVLVRIEERRTGRFGTGVGYGSIDRGFITAAIEQENFRGQGIRVQLDGIYAVRRRGVEAGAVFPWTFHRPIATRIELGYEKVEPRSYTAERLRAGISFSRGFATVWKREIGYQVERLDLLEGTKAGVPTRTKLGRIEAALSRDTRRDLLTRPDGTYLRLSQEWVAPWLGSREHFGRTKMQLRGERPLGKRFGVVLRAFAGWLSPQKGRAIPISERFFAGGTADLRGFPGDGIGPADSLGVPQGGRTLLLGTTELEMRLWKGFYLSGFVDAGELENHPGEFAWERVSVGSGGGLLMRSRLGAFRVEVGFPLTERFADGPRLHFSTGATFF